LTLAFLAIAPPIHAGDDPDFKAMMKKVMDAWGTLDPAKAAPYYSKEANATFFDIAPLKYVGWGAYAAGTSEMFKQWTSLSMTINDDVRIERHGDIAITMATGRAETVGKDGSKNALDWRSTLVWEKKGKDWLISHEHFSTPMPVPQSPAGE
jgi:ketosteroid isomerase-like protein